MQCPDLMRQAETPDPAPRPRWARRNPILGNAPALSEREWRVLGVVAAMALFGQYADALLGLALPQIQASLAIAEQSVGRLGALVQLGALPALALAAAADRLGRRRLLLASCLCYAVLALASALAPDAQSFVALQFFARTFTTSQQLLAVVVLSEELAPAHRGWGIGALFACQAMGVGLAALLLPLVGTAPDAWRGLFAVALVPLLLFSRWRRLLPETAHFTAQRAAHASTRPALRGALPALALVLAAAFAVAAGGSAADFFGAKYLQQMHGWTPGQLSLLYLTGGGVAVSGSAFAGALSDRFGRRAAGAGFGVLVVGIAIAFYSASGYWVAPLWMAMVFANLGVQVAVAAFGVELFPTALRATAAGARLAVATLGSAAGLAAESALFAVYASHWTAIRLLILITLAFPLLVLTAFPETAGRRLDEPTIAPELEPARRTS